MVQDNLLTKCGVPFLHGWSTDLKIPESKKHKPDPGDFAMRMVITSEDGSTIVFEHGKGLIDGHSTAGTLVVVCAIHDPCNLGVGAHTFEVSVLDSTGASILNATGSLIVEDADEGQEPTGGLPTQFDYFTPQAVITSDDVDALPPPEVPEDIYRSRLDICSQCPAFTGDGICTECGCFMPVKAGLTNVSCPLHKWGPYVES